MCIKGDSDKFSTTLQQAVENNFDLGFALNDLTLLHCAVLAAREDPHTECIKALLKKMKKIKPELVNARTETGHTALHFAAINGKEAIVRELIKRNADVNAKEDNGFTPLTFAALRKHPRCVNELIQKCDVDVRDLRNRTPLIVAVKAAGKGNWANEQQDWIEICTKLIQTPKTRLNIQDHLKQKTALHYIISAGHKKIMEPFFDELENREDKETINLMDANGRTALVIAVQRGDKAQVDYLLGRPGIDLNVGLVSPLHVAVQLGQTKIVEALLQNGANPNLLSRGVSPLLVALKTSPDDFEESIENQKPAGGNKKKKKRVSLDNSKIITYDIFTFIFIIDPNCFPISIQIAYFLKLVIREQILIKYVTLTILR